MDKGVKQFQDESFVSNQPGGGGPGQYGDPRVQVMIIMTMLGKGELL